MNHLRTRILIAACLLMAIAIASFSAVGIFAQDSTPTPVTGQTADTIGSASPAPASQGQTAVAGDRGPEIDLIDIAFRPKAFTIPVNRPTIVTIVNQGAAVHNFTIDTLKVRSGDLRPGQKTAIVINAPAGTYTYDCSIPGHRAAGMAGTLTVK